MSFSNEPAFDEPKTNSIENALGTSLRYQVPKIFPLLSTLYILERVAGKICLDFSQFSETTVLCCKNISIMPASPLMLQKNYAGIIRQTLPNSLIRVASHADVLRLVTRSSPRGEERVTSLRTSA